MSSKIRITIISANKSGVPQDIQALETKISNYLPGTRVDEIVEYSGEQVRKIVSISGTSIRFISAIAFSYCLE